MSNDIIKTVGVYCWNLLQALDRLLNALLAGTDKEYLSSRIYRYRLGNRFIWAAYMFLNWLDEDHCEKAYQDAQIGFDPKDAIWK